MRTFFSTRAVFSLLLFIPAFAGDMEIIAEPAPKDRIGDGLIQLLSNKPDGKFSGESEISKLKKTLEIAKWSAAEIEKTIAGGKLKADTARKILLAIAGNKSLVTDYFRDELRNSPLAESLKDLLK